MTEDFENLLSRLFADLVSVSLEYANDSASDIFIYASLEQGYFFDPFFAVGTVVYRRHNLPGVDVSPNRQRALVRYGNDQLQKFASECAELGFQCPTEFKLHYVVSSGKTDADLEYEPQWSNSASLDVSDHSRSEDWKNQVIAALASP